LNSVIDTGVIDKQEVEAKIFFALNFPVSERSMQSTVTRPQRRRDWKIVVKSAEFKREAACEFVSRVGAANDTEVTLSGRACDTR
jgi:hypothetical protein